MTARRLAALIGIVCALGVSGCTSGGTCEDVEARLDQVTSERDALQALSGIEESRRAKTEMTMAGIDLILADQELYGTPDEVADALASYGTETARWIADGFGTMTFRAGWKAALYGAGVAEIDTRFGWISDDGTMSGTEFVWRGVNAEGAPYELIGVSLNRHDDGGVITETHIYFAYDRDYYARVTSSEGTPTTINGEAWDEVATAFGEP